MDFDLSKKAEAFTFELTKKGVTTIPKLAVWAALDISGSMDDEIRDGKMQSMLDQFGGVAIKLDDNGEIDVVKFDDQVEQVGTWTAGDFKTFVKNRGIRARGGTAYSPFIRYIDSQLYGANSVTYQTITKTREVKGFMGFGKKTESYSERVPVAAGTTAAKKPALVLVMTDGEPASENINRIKDALSACTANPIFFAFIGLSNQGNGRFPTLVELERQYENVGFIQAKFNASDEQLYADLVTDKLVGFLNRFPASVTA
jgi:hypothetical protein